MFSQQRQNVSGQNLLTEVLLLDPHDVCLLATRLSDDPSYFSQHASDTMPNLWTGKDIGFQLTDCSFQSTRPTGPAKTVSFMGTALLNNELRALQWSFCCSWVFVDVIWCVKASLPKSFRHSFFDSCDVRTALESRFLLKMEISIAAWSWYWTRHIYICM